MSKTEILEELPKLTSEERREIRLKLTELDGDGWQDAADPLTQTEKELLEARLAAYESDPDAGSSWEEVESRIRSRLDAPLHQ
ncbi:MAG: addiction module protein [Pyrinomonadaceae bacterium]|nr:addiction module protein [Pyrinomonadaceae bacterium]